MNTVKRSDLLSLQTRECSLGVDRVTWGQVLGGAMAAGWVPLGTSDPVCPEAWRIDRPFEPEPERLTRDGSYFDRIGSWVESGDARSLAAVLESLLPLGSLSGSENPVGVPRRFLKGLVVFLKESRGFRIS